MATSVRILIRHPGIDPTDVSAALGLTPLALAKAGDERRTPAGRPLEGSQPISFWVWRDDADAGGDLANSISRAVEALEVAAPFIGRLLAGGGYVEVIVSAAGGTYLGSTVAPEVLARLAALGAHLGFEVYPEGA